MYNSNYNYKNMDYKIIKKAAARANVTLTDICQEAGISLVGLKKGYENETLGMSYIKALCTSLSVTPDYLFGFDAPHGGVDLRANQTGVANTQQIDTIAATSLMEQLRQKDQQINALLEILKNK